MDEDEFVRTDIWREGKWLDLWSVVHFLSGFLVGLGIYLLHFDAGASTIIALLGLILYEMWEMVVHIEETPTNRLMDVVVGMTSFVPAYFLIAPNIPTPLLLAVFGSILGINILLSMAGWRASHKASILRAHMKTRYAKERERLLRQRAKLRRRFRRHDKMR